MGYSSSSALREHTGESQPVDKCISPRTECICRTGQQWSGEYSGGPRRGPENGFRGACGSEAFCRHTFPQHRTLSYSLALQENKTSSRGNHLTHFHPISTAECVHFRGLMACHFSGAFGQELILESKQIFRGAIFHQVLIFLHSQSLYSLI